MTFRYTVSLNDPNHSSQGAALIADINAAALTWSRYMQGRGTIDIQVNITPTTRANGGPLTSAYIGSDGARSVYESGAANGLRTAVEPNGSSPDVIINVDTTYLATR